jgi:hypothetical protein
MSWLLFLRKIAQDGQALILKATIEDGDLAKLAKAVSAGGLSGEKAVAIWSWLDDIGKALEKVGHPEPGTQTAI